MGKSDTPPDQHVKQFLDAIEKPGMTPETIDTMRSHLQQLEAGQLKRLQEAIEQHKSDATHAEVQSKLEQLQAAILSRQAGLERVPAEAPTAPPADPHRALTYTEYLDTMKREQPERFARQMNWFERNIALPAAYGMDTIVRWYKRTFGSGKTEAPKTAATTGAPRTETGTATEPDRSTVDLLHDATHEGLAFRDDEGATHTLALEEAGKELLFVVDGKRYRVSAFGKNLSEQAFSYRNNATMKREGAGLKMSAKAVSGLLNVEVRLASKDVLNIFHALSQHPSDGSVNVHVDYSYSGPAILLGRASLLPLNNAAESGDFTFERING